MEIRCCRLLIKKKVEKTLECKREREKQEKLNALIFLLVFRRNLFILLLSVGRVGQSIDSRQNERDTQKREGKW